MDSPVTKGVSSEDNGYGVYDLYDLGEFDQKEPFVQSMEPSKSSMKQLMPVIITELMSMLIL